MKSQNNNNNNISQLSLDELEKLLINKNNLYNTVGPNLPDKGAKILNTINDIKINIEQKKLKKDEDIKLKTPTTTDLEQEQQEDISNKEENIIYGKPNSMNEDDRLIFQMKMLSMKNNNNKKKINISSNNEKMQIQQQPPRQAKEISLEESKRLFNLNQSKRHEHYDEIETITPNSTNVINREHYPEDSLDETNSSTSEQCDYDNDHRDIYDFSYDYKLHDEWGKFVDDEETSVPQDKYM